MRFKFCLILRINTHFQDIERIMKKITDYSRSHLKVIQKI